ncbi:unnamed protein product [Mytilus coruscus]|uniref:Uncharacterized protein n=1 Tax=Mytilus coruscus TaxID=42192 RepID=A0A6J8DZ33_MYTCO|nr:unnamed protein product [Mytilus coruscus]
MFGCPPTVGLATLQQDEDLNSEMTNRQHGSVSQSSNDDLVALLSQFLTPVNQNSAISVKNSSLPDIHPACETPDSQPTSEISYRQPTSETQDSQQSSDVEASLLDILIPKSQSVSVEEHTPNEVHSLQYEREFKKCSVYFQTNSTLQACFDICIRSECIQRNIMQVAQT